MNISYFSFQNQLTIFPSRFHIIISKYPATANKDEAMKHNVIGGNSALVAIPPYPTVYTRIAPPIPSKSLRSFAAF